MGRLLFPAVLLAAAFALDRGWVEVSLAAPLLTWLERGVCAAVFLLAWRFRRGRFAGLAVVLAATAEALRAAPPAAEGGAPLWLFAACLAPLAMAVLTLLGEWWVLSPGGAIRLGALATAALAAVGVARSAAAAEVAAWLRAPWIDAPALAGWRLPQPALASFALAAAVLGILAARRRTPLEIGALGALAAVLLACEVAAVPDLYLIAAGATLFAALVDSAFSLAFEDGLTGLPGRRALEESLQQLGRSYALAMVDVDHFKKLNDRHGHEVGDQVLRLVATRLARVRGGGTAFRYGGEEFTVLFPGKTLAEVGDDLEELRRAIADHPFAVRGPERPSRKPATKSAKPPSGGAGKQLKVTVSIGAAERGERYPRPEQVMKAADKALYRAKKAGRNRVMTAPR